MASSSNLCLLTFAAPMYRCDTSRLRGSRHHPQLGPSRRSGGGGVNAPRRVRACGRSRDGARSNGWHGTTSTTTTGMTIDSATYAVTVRTLRTVRMADTAATTMGRTSRTAIRTPTAIRTRSAIPTGGGRRAAPPAGGPIPQPSRRRRGRTRRGKRGLVLLAVILALLGSGVVAGGLYYSSIKLPDVLKLPDASTVYYSDGTTLMARLGVRNQVLVDPATLPPYVKEFGGRRRGCRVLGRLAHQGLAYRDPAHLGGRRRQRPRQGASRRPDVEAGGQLVQGQDPRLLPQHCTVRPRRLRHRGGREGVRGEVSEGPPALRGDGPRRDAQAAGRHLRPHPKPHQRRGPAAGRPRRMVTMGVLDQPTAETVGLPNELRQVRPGEPRHRTRPADGPRRHPTFSPNSPPHPRSRASRGPTCATVAIASSRHSTSGPRRCSSARPTRRSLRSVMNGQPENLQAAAVVVEPGTGRVLAYFGGHSGTGADFAGWYFDEAGDASGFGAHPAGATFQAYALGGRAQERRSRSVRCGTRGRRGFPGGQPGDRQAGPGP